MPRKPAQYQDAVWRFLVGHRGQLFCTRCLRMSLGVPGRLDRALFGAEGRGAVRRHGRCANCGHERLLCGLPRTDGPAPML